MSVMLTQSLKPQIKKQHRLDLDKVESLTVEGERNVQNMLRRLDTGRKWDKILLQ